MSESKREKFIRLAENRMNNALKQIELIANLSNTSAYEYSDEDVEQIVKTLKSAISDVEYTFKLEKNKKFKLK